MEYENQQPQQDFPPKKPWITPQLIDLETSLTASKSFPGDESGTTTGS